MRTLNDVLSDRALGRATLARQLLLGRSAMAVIDAVAHLVGLQAQIPRDPYTALWSRLDGFRPEELSQLLVARQVVRIVVMRATIHLVTADDCLLLRPLVQPVLDAELRRHRDHAPRLDGVDLTPVLAAARELLAERPRTGRELRAALGERFPAHDATALAYACRNYLALVQVPPRGLWGRTAQVSSTTAETWLGRPLVATPSIDAVVLRYLAAFGPATPADAATWSRLTGVREVFERLRPQLRTFRDGRGRELFDLPDAPRPDPDTPAPVRILPEYDNAVLSHADRARLIPAHRRQWGGGGPVHGSVLHDGMLAATYRIDRDGGAAALIVHHAVPLTAVARTEIEEEGGRFLQFIAADAGAHEVQFHGAD